jgi:N-acetylneuraminic acid mutarotase
MKRVVIALMLVFSFSSVSAQSNYWMQMDSVNGPGKSVATSFALNGNGYIVGGLTTQDFTRKMYSYSPSSDDWDDELSWGGETGAGQNRGSAISFVINEKAYVGLGQGNSALYYKDMWEYDPVAGTWTQLADFEGSARHGAVAFANENYGYVGTGQSAAGLEKDFYRFDPATNSWLQLNDFPGTARKFATACTMGAEAYLCTGDDGVLKNDIWQYTPATDSWMQKTSMPAAGRVGAVSWGVFPYLFVATGEDPSGQYLNDVWAYNFWLNNWYPKVPLPAAGRTHATAFVVSNVAYLATGYNNGSYFDDCWAYFPELSMEETDLPEITLFPNPAVDELRWNPTVELETLRIVNANGEVLLETSAGSGSADVSELPPATYFAQFTDVHKKNSVTPFVKQ